MNYSIFILMMFFNTILFSTDNSYDTMPEIKFNFSKNRGLFLKKKQIREEEEIERIEEGKNNIELKEKSKNKKDTLTSIRYDDDSVSVKKQYSDGDENFFNEIKYSKSLKYIENNKFEDLLFDEKFNELDFEIKNILRDTYILLFIKNKRGKKEEVNLGLDLYPPILIKKRADLEEKLIKLHLLIDKKVEELFILKKDYIAINTIANLYFTSVFHALDFIKKNAFAYEHKDILEIKQRCLIFYYKYIKKDINIQLKVFHFKNSEMDAMWKDLEDTVKNKKAIQPNSSFKTKAICLGICLGLSAATIIALYFEGYLEA